MPRIVRVTSIRTIQKLLQHTGSSRRLIVLLDLSAADGNTSCACGRRFTNGAVRTDDSPNEPRHLAQRLPSRYRVERVLREGSVASVFLAHDRRLDRLVAIKALRPECASRCNVARFHDEIRTAAKLQHPHLLSVIDSGDSAGLPYFVMPFIAGNTLSDRLLKERQLPVEEALRIAAQVANALDYVHRQGVVHRDIKPDNILLHEGAALISDLGIALFMRSSGDDRLTDPELRVGTPQYMSPEQALGEPMIDGRSDIYSLGCVLYEMLTGTAPFAATTCHFAIAKAVTEAPVAPRALRATIPRSTEELVLKALAKLPGDRFQTGEEFSSAIAAIA
jgi:serine/threonine-protein kinase